MSIIRPLKGGGQVFWCPGCKDTHAVNSHPAALKWTYNQNPDRPTFRPSILVTYKHLGKPGEGQDERCHSVITDGIIDFLPDCTHELAGKAVPLPDWPYAPGTYGGIQETAGPAS
jgi:hypothetical protein